MATFEAARNKYVSDSVTTMSPGQLIVALYDRILLDLEKALSGLAEADVYATHTALMHAQEIVHELLTSLDVKQWPGGASLAAVYRHVQDAADRRQRAQGRGARSSSARRCSCRCATRGAKPPASCPRETRRELGPDRIVRLAHRAGPARRRPHRHRGRAPGGHARTAAHRARAPRPVPGRPDAARARARAEELLARTRRLEALANEEIEGIRSTLRSLAGHRPAPPATTGRIVDFDA